MSKSIIRATASPSCPCCGAAVNEDAEVSWSDETRTLVGRGNCLMLPPHLATIFGELWKARSAKRLVNKTRLMFVLYGDDPDGGPESDNIIAVKLMHLRKAIAPLGLTVRGRFGYFLADIVREEIAA